MLTTVPHGGCGMPVAAGGWARVGRGRGGAWAGPRGQADSFARYRVAADGMARATGAVRPKPL